MEKQHDLILISIFLILFLIVPIMAKSDISNQDYDCSSETLPLELQIEELNQTIQDLMKERDYYKNLSDYYKGLYENKNINVTNKELILLNQNINNFYTEINAIKKELSFLKLTVKISIPIISVTLVSLIGVAIYLKRKIKKKRWIKH